MKIRIVGTTGIFDAWLDPEAKPPTLTIRWPDDAEVEATIEVANQRCLVVWATAAERQQLKGAGFQMQGQ